MKFGQMFRDSDAYSRLSLFIFGLGNIIRGQIVKGILLFALEVSYFYYMITFGWQYLSLLTTLGTVTQHREFNDALGIFIYVQGHDSMLILLFGVMSVLITIAFIFAATKSFQTAYNAQVLKASGKKPPSFVDDAKTLLGKNLHVSLLTLPSLGVFAFTILPLLFMILMAFTNFNRENQPPGNLFTWIGLENFRNLIWQNPLMSRTFIRLLGWTLIWAVFATFSNFFLGTIVALMINKKGIRFKKMWRMIFVTTIAVPQFVSLLLMSRMLHDLGPVNVFLQQMGITSAPIRFLTDGNLARITVIVVNIWVGIPYTMLATTGILMNIPEDIYESARIDGANALQEFFKITMPHLLFVMTPALITAFIGNINNFNVIFLLTGGAPLTLDYFQGGRTDLLVTWLYKLTVNEQNFSLASTVGILVFLITATASLIFFNLSNSVRREDEFS